MKIKSQCKYVPQEQFICISGLFSRRNTASHVSIVFQVHHQHSREIVSKDTIADLDPILPLQLMELLVKNALWAIFVWKALLLLKVVHQGRFPTH